MEKSIYTKDYLSRNMAHQAWLPITLFDEIYPSAQINSLKFIVHCSLTIWVVSDKRYQNEV